MASSIGEYNLHVIHKYSVKGFLTQKDYLIQMIFFMSIQIPISYIKDILHLTSTMFDLVS